MEKHHQKGAERLIEKMEIIEFMLACDPDGILLDKECDIEKTRGLIPEAIPLFGE